MNVANLTPLQEKFVNSYSGKGEDKAIRAMIDIVVTYEIGKFSDLQCRGSR